MGDCIVPMPSDPDCGYSLAFLPPERDMTSLKVQKTSLHYSEQHCTVSCNKTAARTSAENTGFSNSKTFWIYFIVRIFAALFLNAAFCMMVRTPNVIFLIVCRLEMA